MESIVKAQLVDPQDHAICQAVWNILVGIDQEFVPPLSHRSGTTDARFSHSAASPAGNGLADYYHEIIQQNIILAKKSSQWIGLLSFRHCHRVETIQSLGPCNYVTTIGVLPAFRGLGVARTMYNFALMALPETLNCHLWATRTWSGNDYHAKLLADLQFELAATLKDHRAPGVDTLYYVRDRAVTA